MSSAAPLSAAESSGNEDSEEPELKQQRLQEDGRSPPVDRRKVALLFDRAEQRALAAAKSRMATFSALPKKVNLAPVLD